MSTIKVKDSELRAVISALESDLQSAYEASKPALIKADGDAPPKKDGPPEASDDSATPPGDSGSPSPDAGSAPMPPPSPSASPDAAASAAPDASAAPGAAAPGAAPGQDPAAAGPAPLTPEALQAEYAQLAPEELDMHIKAALSAKEALAAAAAPAPGAGAMPGASPAGAPPMAPPPGPDASASPAGPAGAGLPPPPPMAMKGEGSGATGTGGTPSTHAKATGGKMSKSEEDTAALRAELADLKKSMTSKDEDIEILTKSVRMVLERPVQKAITGISYLGKTEMLPPVAQKAFTPSEAKAKLAELIPVLSKSERELVVRFSTGQAKASDLAPIFEKHVK